jgi:ribosomal protein S18 acetylase RimI-like enzyme
LRADHPTSDLAACKHHGRFWPQLRPRKQHRARYAEAMHTGYPDHPGDTLADYPADSANEPVAEALASPSGDAPTGHLASPFDDRLHDPLDDPLYDPLDDPLIGALANPFWLSLTTEHSAFAQPAMPDAQALCFERDVIPFAALAAHTPEAIAALYNLLQPAESIYVTSDQPLLHCGLVQTLALPGLQMVHTASTMAAETALRSHPQPTIVPLGLSDIPSMLQLKQIAFPGYFGPRAAALGRFFGMRSADQPDQLVAMAGERLAVPGWREISAVCTHPQHTGQGHAAALIQHLLAHHRNAGLRTFLHVVASNTKAIALYTRLGFVRTRSITFRQMQRTAEHI